MQVVFVRSAWFWSYLGSFKSFTASFISSMAVAVHILAIIKVKAEHFLEMTLRS